MCPIRPGEILARIIPRANDRKGDASLDHIADRLRAEISLARARARKLRRCAIFVRGSFTAALFTSFLVHLRPETSPASRLFLADYFLLFSRFPRYKKDGRRKTIEMRSIGLCPCEIQSRTLDCTSAWILTWNLLGLYFARAIGARKMRSSYIDFENKSE